MSEHHHSINRKGNERRVALVALLALVAMVLEMSVGMYANSMALFADGIHQATHVLVIGLSWAAYLLAARLERNGNNRYDSNKVLTLAGFTSAVLLMLLAVFIMVEGISRLIEPAGAIRYAEGLVVACIGLVVSFTGALILHSPKGEADMNRRSVYLHLLSDVLTSFGAIVGLACAWAFNVVWIDAVIAIFSSVVIASWAIGVIRDCGKTLTRVG